MGRHIESIETAITPNELQETIEQAAGELGFDYWALTQLSRDGLSMQLQLTNYPAAWAERLRDRSYFLCDPAIKACEGRALPIWWSDVGDFVKMDVRHYSFVSARSLTGLVSGLTAPWHVPGFPPGYFSLASGQHFLPSRPIEERAMYLAAWSMEQIRTIAHGDDEDGPTSAEEKLVLKYTARGYGPAAIAVHLRMRTEEVRSILTQLQRKGRAASLLEVVARKIHHGELLTTEILS
jgi:DNA-binding CsgD family transcriptional regulator